MRTHDSYNQYALIAKLGRELGQSSKFGKKALQKVVHLISDLAEVKTGYQFSFYTYGPYSENLSYDLSIANSLKAVAIAYNEKENYYLIKEGPKAKDIEKAGDDFLKTNADSIHPILKFAKGKTAKELELVSTIVFLQKRDQENELKAESKLIERVRTLKPKYSEQEIKNAIIKITDLKQEIREISQAT